MAIRRPLAVLIVAVAALAISQSALATGWWNLPCTCWQWNGCGYGGGYHAPLVLGPLTHECFQRPNQYRVDQAPNPYACAPYNGESCGCNGGAEATSMPPSSQPVQTMSNPEAMRPMMLFQAPSQY